MSFVSARGSHGGSETLILSSSVATFAVAVMLIAAAVPDHREGAMRQERTLLFRGGILDDTVEETSSDDASQSFSIDSRSTVLESPVSPLLNRGDESFKSPFSVTTFRTIRSRIRFDSRSFENYLMSVPGRELISLATDEPTLGSKSVAQSFNLRKV